MISGPILECIGLGWAGTASTHRRPAQRRLSARLAARTGSWAPVAWGGLQQRSHTTTPGRFTRGAHARKEAAAGPRSPRAGRGFPRAAQLQATSGTSAAGRPYSQGLPLGGLSQTLKQACSRKFSRSAMCVQRFDDSLSSAIHITYRISLRSSSLQ